MKTLLCLLLLAGSAFAADFTITISLPDSRAQAVIDDIAEASGYTATVSVTEPTGQLDSAGQPILQTVQKPNPESKVAFLKRITGQDLIAKLKSHRAQKAAKAAADKSQVETDEAAKNVTVK